MIVWTEPVILTRLCWNSFKHEEEGCRGFVLRRMAALRCLHNRVFLNGGWRNSTQHYQQKVRKRLSAAHGCTLLSEDASGGLVTEDGDFFFYWFFFLNKPKKSAIYQVCSVHLHGMQHFSFRLQTHRSDSALIAPTKAKRSTLTDLGSFAGPAPKLMTCLCSMLKCQMFPRCDCSLLLSPSASAGFLLSCTRRRR